MIRFLLFAGLLVGSVSTAFSQKVKYKELILLLNAKQYDQAEPFLKKYLKENDDNPNAFLFMALIFQEKSLKQDPLTQTDILVTASDSALFYYAKAAKGIDDRELKKNDEYYESYARRDIRTGKFGVKLSDIQLDIEDRTKAIKERSDRAKLLKNQFQACESTYKRSVLLYKKMLDAHTSEKQFYILADEATISELKKIEQAYDSSLLSFKAYKATSQLMGKAGRNQSMAPKAINDLKKDGYGDVDFLAENIAIWDYKTWCQKTSEVVTTEIIPLRGRLIAYDIEINKLRDKQQKDSVSVLTELMELANKLKVDHLRKFDADPFPMAVFEMKVGELEYVSGLILHKKLKDSLNVRFRLETVKSELTVIKRLDSISKRILIRDFNAEGKLYKDFVTKSYGTVDVLHSLVKSTVDYAGREKLKREHEWERTSQSLKWLINGADSIPLFNEVGREYKFKPLVVAQENHTAGLVFADSLATGYFYTITPSRFPDVKVTFTVDKENFKKRNLPLLKGLSVPDARNQIYFVLIYSEVKSQDKFPATITKIYRTDGLAWSINIGMDMPPSELTYSIETNELSIKMTNPSGESRMLMLDKNGKPLQ
jgi:hypothetical protein